MILIKSQQILSIVVYAGWCLFCFERTRGCLAELSCRPHWVTHSRNWKSIKRKQYCLELKFCFISCSLSYCSLFCLFSLVLFRTNHLPQIWRSKHWYLQDWYYLHIRLMFSTLISRYRGMPICLVYSLNWFHHLCFSLFRGNASALT